MALALDYFYGNEAEQYSFYRIPKALFTDRWYKTVPVEAKVLYGLLLDRMSLSVRNGWLDSHKRVYIYFTLEDAMEQMNCGKDKAIKLFKDLDVATGIGLIERRRQGQGRPTRIYVKNFVLPTEPEPESGVTENTPRTSENPQSRLRKNRSPEFGKTDPNKTNQNQTESIKTEWNETDLSIPSSLPVGQHQMDEMEERKAQIKENIGYAELLSEYPRDQNRLFGYVELLAEVCCTHRKTIRICGEEKPIKLVRERFLSLTKEHIVYVLESMRKNASKAKNLKAYTLAALFNAPVTIGQYRASSEAYRADSEEVDDDMRYYIMQLQRGQNAELE